MDIWIVSTFGLLYITLQWTFAYKSLCFHFPWVGMELLGHTVILCQNVFQCGCLILHPYQQHMRGPVSPHHCQHLLLFVFLILSIFVCVKWYHIMVLICISLMTNNVEQLFTYLLMVKNVKMSLDVASHFFSLSYICIWSYLQVRLGRR